MRAFKKGEPFTHVSSERHVPDEDCLTEMMDDLAENPDMPVFSEAFLYPRVGKDDARFILGVAEEYEHVIKVLGADEVRSILERRAPSGRREGR